jgi:hypothetical protein
MFLQDMYAPDYVFLVLYIPATLQADCASQHNYSRTPLLRINWDGEPSGYAENPDNWIFVSKYTTLAV